MNTILSAPVIAQADTVILGGGLRALMAAAESTAKGTVLLAASDTFIPGDICATQRYNAIVEGAHPLWQELYKAAVCGGTLHPDRLKLAAEALCERLGVKLLYAVQPVGRREGALTLAGKFGVGVVRCTDVYDLRGSVVDPNRLITCLENCRIAPGLYCSEGYSARLSTGCADGQGLLAFYLPEGADRFAGRRTVIEGFKALKKLPGWQSVVLGRFAAESCRDDLPITLPTLGEALKGAPTYAATGCGELPEGLTACNPLAEECYSERTCPDIAAPKLLETQVLVVGGGTAGVPAAIYSAENGAETMLCEMNGGLGGTGTLGGVSAYWFGKRFEETRRIDRRVLNIANGSDERTRSGIWGECDVFHPGIKEHALAQLCREAGVRVLDKQTAFAAITESGRITGVLFADGSGTTLVRARVVVDATGDGDLAVFCGAPTTYGAYRDGFTYWSSLAQYKDGAAYQNNFAGLVRVDDPNDYTRFICEARQRGEATFDHGSYLAPRETRHIEALRMVTLRDVCGFRNYEDCICTCYSNYDPKGRADSDMLCAGVLPLQSSAAVPLGAVLPKGVDCLLVGGKAIGCTHNAIPPLRMQPDLQHQGAALGILAAGWALEGRLRPDYTHITAQTGDPLRVAEQPVISMEGLVRDFCDDPQTNWVALDFAVEQTRLPPAVALLTAEPTEAVPLLAARFKAERDRQTRLLLAAFLLYFGQTQGAELVEQHLLDCLKSGLPKRGGSLQCVQMLPDHGVMAEPAYLLHMLAYSGLPRLPGLFGRVCELLLAEERDWFDNSKALYPYAESVAYAAERDRRAEFIPLLRSLTAMPELSAYLPPSDLRRERLMMLKLTLWRALRQLGYRDAEDELIKMTQSSIAPIAFAARRALTEKPLDNKERRW